MSRLTKLTKAEVPADVAALYEKVGQLRGNVPNMFRVYAHRPEILKTMVAHLNAVTEGGMCRCGRRSWWRRSCRG